MSKVKTVRITHCTAVFNRSLACGIRSQRFVATTSASVAAQNIPNRAGATPLFCGQSAQRLGLLGVTWHLLRHSHATMLDSVGTPIGTIQSLLGHSTPEITREIYLHAIPEEQRRAVESVERLVFGPKWTQVQAPARPASARVN